MNTVRATGNAVARLTAWMAARHAILRAREEGYPKPWTADPILQRFKFCNVYRELDRVTIWIREHIREPYADHPNLWFMLAMARRINWPDTLAEIIEDKKGAWPVRNYSPGRLLQLLDARTARGEQVYTGAYMITAEHVTGETKSRATAFSNLGRLWDARKEVTPHLSNTLDEAFGAILGKGFAWGGFMTAQVVADLKHTRYLQDAPDWHTWAASGPGSRRGLNRVLGRELNAPWVEDDWQAHLSSLQDVVNKPSVIKSCRLPSPLCAQDLQNCLCEFDKYERARLGEGRPRSSYPGAA